MEALNGGAEMWVFGKDHNNTEMQYPFRKEEEK